VNERAEVGEYSGEYRAEFGRPYRGIQGLSLLAIQGKIEVKPAGFSGQDRTELGRPSRGR
jgi:hypothetical protein